MYYKVASIVLNSEQKTSTSSDIFIAQPDSHKEALAGKLFILIEIESSKADALKLTNFLVNTLNYNYYQNEKIALRESIKNIKIESIFQDCLAKTNHALIDFLEQEKIKISPYAFNINVAVIHEDELHFSSVGKHKNLLIYKDKNNSTKLSTKGFEPEKAEYKINNIGADTSKKTETVNINKLFSDITSGHIPSNGYLLMINEALAEYMSNKQLLKIVTKLSPAGAAEQIKNTLSQINAYVSFLGVIIKNSTNSEITHEEIRKEMEEKNNKYSNEITALEQKTEKIMAPAGIIDFKKIMKSFSKKIHSSINSNNNINQSSKKKKIFIFKDHVFFKKRTNIFKSIQTSGHNLFKNIFGFLSMAFKFTTFKKNNAGESVGPLKQIKTLISEKEQNGGFKKRNKIILIVAFVFLIIFAINLFNLNKKHKTIAEKEAFENIALDIEKNQNKIDANLLYNNENNAKKLIDETMAQITELENKKEKNQDRINSILTKQSQQINTIRRVTNVSVDKKIADFSILSGEAKIDNLILNNDQIYLADAKEKAIYQINLKEEINTANRDLPENITRLDYPTVNSDKIYYFNKESIIILDGADREKKITKSSINIPADSRILSMKSFNNSIYLLSDKQIYKLGQRADQFTEPEPWLKNEMDLSDAIDINIDGFVYILKKNGSIDKFLRGQKEDFTIDNLYLPIKNASKSINSDKQEYIYIGEFSEKRLVVFDESGKFVMQYVFDNIEEINDIEVSEINKKIYILSNTSVFETDLTHIQ